MLLCLFCLLFAISIYADQGKQVFDYINVGNINARVAALVITYPVDTSPSKTQLDAIMGIANQKYNKPKHLIVLPDSDVIVCFPKSKFNQVKNLLGDQLLILDPSIECKTPDCIVKD